KTKKRKKQPYSTRASIVENAGTTRRIVNAVNDPTPLGRRICERRNIVTKAKVVAKEVDDVLSVGESTGRTDGEVDSVGRIVGLHQRRNEEVVVAIVDQRASEHEHSSNLRVLSIFSLYPAAGGGGGGGAASEERREEREN
ncbi:hypothetical protein U1Q18_037026, partial [Sarracenia purpurea var. burkii]